MKRKDIAIDLENHKYTNGLGVAFFKFTKKNTPFLIEFYSENSFCTEFISYYGTFCQAETIKNIDIVHSMKNYVKYKYLNNKLSIEKCPRKCISLTTNHYYIKIYDIYTGKNALDRLETYKNLNLVSQDNIKNVPDTHNKMGVPKTRKSNSEIYTKSDHRGK